MISLLSHKGSAYLRLMRFDKPIGIWLLWWPTAWALWLANPAGPSLYLIALFFLGTVIMRAAGCIINDIADRHIDCHAQRTNMRPLTNGEISLIEALVLFLSLLLIALLILLQLPLACFYFALFSVVVTIIYPFCKRFIQCPQLVLGIAFSMGIPMAFAASSISPFSSLPLILFILNALWIISYDTQYAMVDREDDLRIGIQSSAILFGDYDRLIIALLQGSFHSLWLVLFFLSSISITPFLMFWTAAGLLLVYQQRCLATKEKAAFFQAFKNNQYYGFLMWLGLVLS